MLSILVHGADQQQRKGIALKLLAGRGIEEGTNLIEIGREKVGIREIKALLPHLHVRPAAEKKAVVIFEAQRLTIAAQNALLKILEEPPAHLVIVLTVPNPRLLLPTVVSRCLIIDAKGGKPKTREKPSVAKSNLAEEIFGTQGGQRLTLFEERIGYRQKSVLTFLDGVEIYLHSEIEESLNPKGSVASAPHFLTPLEFTQLLIRLWRAKKLLRDESANAKLIVDELLLSW